VSGLVVSTRGETELVLTRRFDAPRELVYAALTTPELLVRWHGARGWNLVACEVDLRVGGAYRYVSRGPGGDEMTQRGVYLELEEPERLVCTEVFDDQSYPGETVITTELTGRTTMTSTVRYATRQGLQTALAYPMERGVGESYDRLEQLLDESEATDELDA
jgi:uncharacterized protein YndB with AHSA1/START domain